MVYLRRHSGVVGREEEEEEFTALRKSLVAFPSRVVVLV